MRHKRGAKLGQHFLTGQWAARKLAEAAGIERGDTVLEIGPGTGALTKELLRMSARVIAVEKDESLVEVLSKSLNAQIDSGKLTIVPGDVRDLDLEATNLGAYTLAANIPYYITGEIIRKFLTAKQQPKTMALLVQKEVAERIVARDSKESILSISVKAYGKPEIAAKVSKGNFNPPPSVDSAILVVRNISKKFFANLDEALFFKIVRAGFSSKRKFLAGNLAKEFGRDVAVRAFENARVHEKARAENLTIEQWKSLAQTIANFPS